jgi:hypothetical protein
VSCDPVGSQEICTRLGVARNTVNVWRQRSINFPPNHRWTVSGWPAWNWPDVQAWAESHRKAHQVTANVPTWLAELTMQELADLAHNEWESPIPSPCRRTGMAPPQGSCHGTTDPTGRGRPVTMPVELYPNDYRHDADLPDDLPFDEATCATPDCGAPIGFGLRVTEDAYGREREVPSWSSTWRTSDGALLCEDCACDLMPF